MRRDLGWTRVRGNCLLRNALLYCAPAATPLGASPSPMKHLNHVSRTVSGTRLNQWLFRSLVLVVVLTETTSSAQVQQAWAQRYHGPGPGDDGAVALKVDSRGNVYVTGWITRTKADSDYATVKYAPDGTQLWTRSYAGIGNSIAAALDLDASGNVYV